MFIGETLKSHAGPEYASSNQHSTRIFHLFDNTGIMQKYLELTPAQFDQDSDGGWRVLAREGLYNYVMSEKQDCDNILHAISIMQYYVDNYQFTQDVVYKQQLILFHIGQLYAEIQDYASAIHVFEKLRADGYTNVGVEYLDFTIAFLRGDRGVCHTILTGLPQDGSVASTEIIRRMMDFWGCSYLEAYYGIKWYEIKEEMTQYKT